VAQTKPAPGTWTYEDLFSLPEDGKRYEIIDGVLYVLPSVGWAHASVVMKLLTVLLPIAKNLGGQWLTAPLDVFVAGGDPVQPDLLLMLPGGAARTVMRGIEGPPDLVIEVVTPTNRVHDLLTKRALYGRAGVREYWIVDAETRTLEILALDRDALHLVITASGADRPLSPLLGPLTIAVDDLFAGIDA
jgi:Uma2 family endonuclease